MEGLFDSIDDFVEPEEIEVEILEETTQGVRSFYKPELIWNKESLWYRLKNVGITIYERR